MALSTQCPHCKTIFRVASDQLKLRSGLVRCGSCKQIFNGIEHLIPEGAAVPPQLKPTASAAPAQAAPAPAAPASAAPVKPPTAAAPSIDFVSMEPERSVASSEQIQKPQEALTAAAQTASAEEDKEEEEDPLLRMTVMTIVPQEEETAAEEPASDSFASATPAAEETKHLDSAAAVAPAIETAVAKDTGEAAAEAMKKPTAQPIPLPSAQEQAEETYPEPEGLDEDEDEDEETEAKAPAPGRRPLLKEAEEERNEEEEYEPSFVVNARKRQRRNKILRIFMSFAAVILLLALIGQSAYVFRTQLAAWFPQSKPLLAQFCQVAGCQVKLPAQIDMVSIESTELQAVVPNKNVFALTVLLRNRSSLAQAWPNIELTLNDSNEQAVARRVLLPRDYLPSAQDIAKGFSANSEQPIKLNFELAQVKASGFRVYLFYP